MVSSFYGITDFISKACLSHPNVATFTYGNLDDIDLAKQTQFPLAHLMVNTATISSGKIEYDITLLVMDRVGNITPESSGKLNELEKDYKDVDNSLDIWNTTFEVINDVYSYTLRNPDALDYNIIGDASLTPFKDRFDNLLAGWGADFTVSVGNENNQCIVSV